VTVACLLSSLWRKKTQCVSVPTSSTVEFHDVLCVLVDFVATKPM
jgi:hypothetical protein